MIPSFLQCSVYKINHDFFFPEIYIKLKEEFPPLKKCVVVSIRVFIMTAMENVNWNSS